MGCTVPYSKQGHFFKEANLITHEDVHEECLTWIQTSPKCKRGVKVCDFMSFVKQEILTKQRVGRLKKFSEH